MGIINILGKWNLEQKDWVKSVTYYDRGRSLAFANYDQINSENGKDINYVIFAYGTRVEDHSKDYVNIKETMRHINKVIRYFEQTNKNVIIQLFLFDADAPILEDAKLLAKYIDGLSFIPNTNSINVIGTSKGGCMAFSLPKYFSRFTSFEKTNIYTVATPFDGTKLASPKIFYPDVKRLIKSKFGDNKFADLLYEKLISIYEGISSNSHMDYDIAMLGGVPDSKLHLYDESLIRDMFSSDNINAISRVSSYKNFITGIDDETLSEAIRTVNFEGIGLCLLNDLFFDKKSDGMVMTSSQRLVESAMEEYGIKSHILTSSHHAISGIDRVMNDLLHVVDDTIGEQVDRAKYRARIK